MTLTGAGAEVVEVEPHEAAVAKSKFLELHLSGENLLNGLGCENNLEPCHILDTLSRCHNIMAKE